MLEIGGAAFSGKDGLSCIEIPESVVKIEGNPFSYCSNLNAIEVSPKNKVFKSITNSLLTKDGLHLKSGCNNSVIPRDVAHIGVEAFAGCAGLTSIEIPNSVYKIEDMAFKDCKSLISIKIPEGVNEIGWDVFEGCTSITHIKSVKDSHWGFF